MVDQARVEQLGVARPQRTAVFDATDTVFAATTTVASSPSSSSLTSLRVRRCII